MPIIQLTFTDRRNGKYTTGENVQLAQLVEQHQTPDVPDDIQYRLPKLDKPTVSMAKNIFPPLNTPVYANVYLKTYDFDSQEGERIIGASFQCSAFSTTPPVVKPKISLAKPAGLQGLPASQ
jgi:hypothetical protein